jgi:hypothetical protein
MYVVSVVVSGIYLVCLAWLSVLFLLPPSQARLLPGEGVGLCGVFCVCGGFVLFVCCGGLFLLFRRRFEVCGDGCFVFESKRAERVR